MYPMQMLSILIFFSEQVNLQYIFLKTNDSFTGKFLTGVPMKNESECFDICLNQPGCLHFGIGSPPTCELFQAGDDLIQAGSHYHLYKQSGQFCNQYLGTAVSSDRLEELQQVPSDATSTPCLYNDETTQVSMNQCSDSLYIYRYNKSGAITYGYTNTTDADRRMKYFNNCPSQLQTTCQFYGKTLSSDNRQMVLTKSSTTFYCAHQECISGLILLNEYTDGTQYLYLTVTEPIPSNYYPVANVSAGLCYFQEVLDM